MAVSDVFRDLYNLEINLIESRHMTGRKMDTFSSGMAQIANKYATFLHREEFAASLWRTVPPDLVVPGEGIAEGVAVGTYRDLVEELVQGSDSDYSEKTFEYLVCIAKEVLDEGEFIDDEHRGVAIRIVGVSQQLRIIAKRWGDRRFLVAKDPADLDPAELTDPDRLQIRKAWDIGTSVVVMQTVAQLDGDIITRITPARASEEHVMLHRLNERLVGTSLDHWRVLFETVASLVGKAVSKVLPG